MLCFLASSSLIFFVVPNFVGSKYRLAGGFLPIVSAIVRVSSPELPQQIPKYFKPRLVQDLVKDIISVGETQKGSMPLG